MSHHVRGVPTFENFKSTLYVTLNKILHFLFLIALAKFTDFKCAVQRYFAISFKKQLFLVKAWIKFSLII